MKIIIKLRKTKGEARNVSELFKEIENVTKKYSFVESIDLMP